MGDYPPGTWAGDPRAPWNEEDAPRCGDCASFAPVLDGSVGVCLARLRRFDAMDTFEALDVSARDADEDVCEDFS